MSFDKKLIVLESLGPITFRISIAISLLAKGRKKDLENFVRSSLSKLRYEATYTPERFT